MAQIYAIKCRSPQGEVWNNVAGHVIKIGKGKKAVAVLGYRKDGALFVVDHIPTGLLFCGGYYYQNLAKRICLELVEHVGERLAHNSHEEIVSACPQPLCDYCEFWMGRDIKEPPVFVEWLNGPEYQDLLAARRNRELLKQQKNELAQTILSSDSSLGWVLDHNGGIEGSELAAIIDGKPY